MEGLGLLGFWLGLGIFLGAGAVAGAIKELGKDREKQATLRALVERGGGEGATEILAYLREKDAAERQIARDAMGLDWGPRQWAFFGAIMVAMFALIGGLGTFAYMTAQDPPPQSWVAPVGAMFGVWAAGLVIAGLLMFFSRARKNGPPPGA